MCSAACRSGKTLHCCVLSAACQSGKSLNCCVLETRSKLNETN